MLCVMYQTLFKYGDYLQNLRLFSLDEKVIKSFCSSFINLLLYVFLSYTKPSSSLHFMAVLKSLVESIQFFSLWWQLFMDQISFSIPQKYKFQMDFSFLIASDLFFYFFPNHLFRQYVIVKKNHKTLLKLFDIESSYLEIN